VLDQLRVILAAEAAARQQFEAAREEGARLVRQAEADGRQQVRVAREARDSLAHAVEDRIVADAQREASRILEDANTAAAAMRAAAEPRMAEAAEAIIRCLLGPAGEADHGG
jgi:vacuolar-type H+-ATPase subunit H